MSMQVRVNGIITQPPLRIECSQSDFPLMDCTNSVFSRRNQILFHDKRMKVLESVQIMVEMEIVFRDLPFYEKPQWGGTGTWHDKLFASTYDPDLPRQDLIYVGNIGLFALA